MTAAANLLPEVAVVPQRTWVRPAVTSLLLSAALLGSVLLGLAAGSVAVPLDETVRVLLGGEALDPRHTVIARDIRMPAVLTAALAGSALGVAGLQMQTLFRNPLADPYILGASSGASLGVAVVVLASGSTGASVVAGLTGGGRVAVVAAAALGAGGVLGLVLLMSRVVRSSVSLLLIGVMIGSLGAALVSLMVLAASPEALQQFTLWGQGSFAGTTWGDLRVAAPLVAAGLLLAVGTVKSLNALLLGESYARSMGVGVRRARLVTVACGAVLTGVTTAYCGPVGFLGLVVPHLARAAYGTANHRVLLPGVVLVGATVAVLCGTLAAAPGQEGRLPLNAVTALIGAPVVILVLVRARTVAGGAV